ncbi:MAG: glycosyltransferase [Niabella sp.]
MSQNKQVFETENKIRWNSFKWGSRIVIFLLILIVPVVWISLGRNQPFLPKLEKTDFIKNKKLVIPKGLSKKEAARYKGFQKFLEMKRQNNAYIARDARRSESPAVRAAFYVDWDPQSFSSLKAHVDKLNMVIPEWFFIDPAADTLVARIDQDALQYMRRYKVKIVPIISNVNISRTSGDFDGNILDRVMQQPGKRKRLIDQIESALEKNRFAGINLDFEEIRSKTLAPLFLFQKELYERLHAKELLVTQDIVPNDDNYNLEKLNPYLDYIFLMAYDQHFPESVPGSISEQRWIEKVLDNAAVNINSKKIILCAAAYGYDWPEGGDAANVTYAEAIALAKDHYAPIDFDNDTYNCSFSYKDVDSVLHRVYFNDAAGNFNTMRFADDYGVAGIALWRLGSEDERLWSFYNKDLRSDSVAVHPEIFAQLQRAPIGYEKPDYIGDGEVLDMITEPGEGIMKIGRDSIEDLISEEQYVQLPTKYIIKKFGQVHNQVLLTFDDGPDPVFTPRILDILKKENVPAAFFVVGINAENNLSLLKKIYKDGFEIGNHTFTHPNIAEVGKKRATTEIEATRLLIESTIGHSTVLFRPPYNADAEPTSYVELEPIAIGKRHSYYAIGESIDPEDWDTENPTYKMNADTIYNRVIRQYEANPEKGVILLHDAGGPRQATVDALPRIIEYFKKKNIQFITVARLLNLKKDQVMPPVKGNLLQADSFASRVIAFFSAFLNIAFWLAIVLGILRILFLGVLAVLGYFKGKKERHPAAGIFVPRISIIVPAYNEEVNCVATVKSLLQQDYPDLEIIFVDDGSKDKTFEKITTAFHDHPKVKAFRKENGGKASALNYGIERAASDFLLCIDADTQLKKNAISQMMPYFQDEKVGAVAGNVKVGNTGRLLTKWQSIEYITAQNFDRRAFDYINGITVVPGAIGAFSKKAMQDAGGFTTDSLAEDCDLTIRILRQGYIIRNCTEAIAVTEAPETVSQFLKQRFRWSYGIMQSFWKNRDACFNAKYRGLGLVSLPNILLFQIIMPLIAPLADLLFFIGLFYNRHDANSMQQILLYYFLFLLIDVFISVVAFRFERENYWRLLWLLPQRFAYRQLMYIVLFRSVRRAIKGEGQGWGSLKRTGNVVLKE